MASNSNSGKPAGGGPVHQPMRKADTDSDSYNRKRKPRIGIVGGVGALAGADLFFKLVKSTPARSDSEHFDILFEQRAFDDRMNIADTTFNPRSRKFYVYNTVRELARRAVDTVLLPCFISHTFLDEIQPEIAIPIVSLLDALRRTLQRDYPDCRKLGILTSTYVRDARLFDKALSDIADICYPTEQVQQQCLMEAIYGEQGIKAGHLQGRSIDLLRQSCEDLVHQGAELIVPGFTEIPMVIDALRATCPVPILDCNQIYVDYVLAENSLAPARPFTLGVVGGVGPAATTDFMNKVIAHTQAVRDQDHIKMLVEHNPKIPDRTAHLIHGDSDPTIALFSACKKLESQGADAIAIPCNTAHAFVEPIQRYLHVPIINMVEETVKYIKHQFPEIQTVGLLATSGTVASGLYQTSADRHGLQLITPDPPHQERVMSAIYGGEGVKAGYRAGRCEEDFVAALRYVMEQGAQAVILGCTELPLITGPVERLSVDDRNIPAVDPTEILARGCVAVVHSIQQ